MGEYPELSSWTFKVHKYLYQRKAEGDVVVLGEHQKEKKVE